MQYFDCVYVRKMRRLNSKIPNVQKQESMNSIVIKVNLFLLQTISQELKLYTVYPRLNCIKFNTYYRHSLI